MRLFVVLALCAVACVDSGPGPQPRKIDKEYVASHVLKEAPADLERWDVQLGDSVVYLGNKVDKPRVAPGQAVTITHYWEVTRPISARWRPFGLVRGPPNTEDFMNLQPTDMQLARPPSSWQPKEIIEDVQIILLRPDWRSPEATVLVGLIEDGGHGPLDRMAATGPHTRDRAIVARVLEVDLARAVRPGTIHIPRATGPITIDGMASDQGWVNAVTSPEFVMGEGSAESAGKAIAKMTWDDDNLYVFVSITDPDIVATYKKHDDSLWQEDCIELFIDADSSKSGYIELQVSPNNITFDSWFATTRAQPGDVTWNSNMVTKVKLRGTTEGGDNDIGWDVEIAIPWADMKGRDDKMKFRIPPQVGDRMRLNVVRVDKRGKDTTWSSWNRIASDFHGLDRMLVAIFADPTGSTIPVKELPGAGSGSGSGADGSAGSGSAGSGSAGSGSAGSGSAGSGSAGSGSAASGSAGGSAAGSAGSASAAAGSGEARFEAGSAAPSRTRIVIAVPATGDATVDGKRVLDADIEKVLRVAAQADRTANVVIEAAAAAPRDRVNKLVDVARRAGLTRVTVVDTK